jgi:hypothetical protein
VSRPAETDAAPCDRFEREGLLRLEQGLPLDPHFDTCADCRAARAEYERLHAGIHDLGRAHTGRADWQARVWAGVAGAGERRARRRRRWLWIMAPLAAAALLALLLRGRGPGPAEPALAYALRRPGQSGAMRGEHARPGDVVDVNIRTTGAAHAELRIYRDDQALIVRCTDQPPCVRRGAGITATIRLDERGRYQIVLLYGKQPLAAPGAHLDDDLARARAAGAGVELRELDVL